MQRQITLLCLVLLVSGCARIGESRLNPFNWFGSSDSVQTEIAQVDVVDPNARSLIPEVTDLTIERRPGGVIIRATGLPDEQGWFDAALVATTVDATPIDGVLSFTFEARPPISAGLISTDASRAVVVGRFLDTFDLAGVREIRVIGAENTRVSRR